MIPRWKVVRELDRLRQQLDSLLGLFWEPTVQKRYDLNRKSHLKVAQGERPRLSKVAIYLLYQPETIRESTLETCRLIEDQGYSTLVVSNAALSPESRNQLKSVSWRVIERPNYGYDFGGYRDGILHLADEGFAPDRLLVMNDSVWFPLSEADTFLKQLESSDLDVGGTIIHHRSRRSRLRRGPGAIIESYFFSFSKRAFESEVFKDFWLNYRMSSNKYNAVHRGERRVADEMRDGGLRVDGFFSREDFLKLIRRKDAAYLFKALRYSNTTNQVFEANREKLLSEYIDSESWCSEAISYMEKVTAKHSFFSAFPFVAAGELGVPLLKCTSGALQIMARKSLLAAIENHDLDAFRPSVMRELIARDHNDSLRQFSG